MFGLSDLDRMNAAEIRRRAEAAAARLPDVTHLLKRVLKAIEDAAENGEMHITTNPLLGLRCPISAEEFDAVYSRLRSMGYVVSPGKRFEISWRKEK